MNASLPAAPVTLSGAASRTDTRFFGLDGVRAAAMLLGVLYHAILFGGGMMPGFGGPRGTATWAMDWIHHFRMPMFFLISGFFCHLMYAKYGLGRYLARRWYRLGVALLLVLFSVAGLHRWSGGGMFGGGGPGGGFRPGGGPPGGGGPGRPAGPERNAPSRDGSSRSSSIAPPPGPGRDGAIPDRFPDRESGPPASAPGENGGPIPGGRPAFTVSDGAGGPGDEGGAGGPGRRGPAGPGGPPGLGGPGAFGPGAILANAALHRGDENGDGALSKAEFERLGDAWWGKLDAKASGVLASDAFAENLNDLFPPPPGFGPPGDGRVGGRRFGPGMFLGRPLFIAADADHNGNLTRDEWRGRFPTWFDDWDRDRSGALADDEVRQGFDAAIGIGGGPGGRGGPGGPGGPGRMPFGRASPMANALFGSLASEMNLSFLWFLWYLLVFLTVAPGFGWLGSRCVALAGTGMEERLTRWGGEALRWGWMALVLALISLPGRMATTNYGGWALGGASGIFQAFPDVLFRYQPDWPFYFSYFFLGWCLFALRSALPAVGRTWLPLLVVGTASYLGAVHFSDTYGRQEELAGTSPYRVAGHGLFALAAACTSFGFLGVFQRYLDRPTRVSRYLADTAFWIYVVHQELLTNGPVFRWVQPWGLPPLLQAMAATLIVSALALVSFEILVRRTPLCALFGPTRSKSRQPPHPPVPGPSLELPTAVAGS